MTHPEPRPPFDPHTLTIAVDLDETLWSSFKIPGMYGHSYGFTARPGAEALLQTLLDLQARGIQVMFWTAATRDYAEEGLRQLSAATGMDITALPLWSRARCTLRYDPMSGEAAYFKPLRRLKVNRNHVLLIDDRLSCPEHHGNWIRVAAFDGEPGHSETEMLSVAALLRSAEQHYQGDIRAFLRKHHHQPRPARWH